MPPAQLTQKENRHLSGPLGVILLLVGQLLTDVFSTRARCALSEGGSKNYSDSKRGSELAIVESISTETDQVVAIRKRSGKSRGNRAAANFVHAAS